MQGSNPLTAGQMALLRYIHGYQLANGGISPTLQECATATGVSKTLIFDRLRALECKGVIKRLPFRNRGIDMLMPSIPTIERCPALCGAHRAVAGRVMPGTVSLAEHYRAHQEAFELVLRLGCTPKDAERKLRAESALGIGCAALPRQSQSNQKTWCRWRWGRTEPAEFCGLVGALDDED
jgi:hypothetical protein